MNLTGPCYLAGSPTRDLLIAARDISFPDHTVRFETDHGRFEVPYHGEAICWGDKRTAACRLNQFAELSDVPRRNGGGVINTRRHLLRLPPNRRPSETRIVSTTLPYQELEDELGPLGESYVCVGNDPVPTNVILFERKGPTDRIILTDPVPLPPLNFDPIELLRKMPGASISLLATNSPKRAELARGLSAAASETGAPQYIELTRSLPAVVRDELMARARLAAGNLTEFAEVLEPLGVSCPSDEDTARLDDVARALKLAAAHVTGDLVAHMGARGCVGADSRTGLLFHLAARPGKREQINFHLRAHPERANGRGDRFFGSLFTAHAWFQGDDQARSRLARAALQASIDVVASFSSSLRPDASWFDFHIFPDRIGNSDCSPFRPPTTTLSPNAKT